MPFSLKKLALAGTACALIAGCSAIGIGGKPRLGQARPLEGGVPMEQGSQPPYPAQPSPDDAARPAYSVSESVQYDDVGYAGVYADAGQARPTSTGEQYNPNGMMAAHPTLPIPSFVEVTNLNTGKTVLVRIIERSQAGQGRLIDMSPGALTGLGAETGAAMPIRVRRVNPSEPEKSALGMGRRGGDRLDTPEPLLVALRKKLGTPQTGPSTPSATAVERPRVAPPRTATAVPPPTSRRPTRPGANYEQRIAADTSDRTTAAQQPAEPQDNGGDGYVREEAGRPAPRGPAQIRPAMGGSGAYFIQIAAFSDRGRADVVARQMGARVERAGTIWRVKKGPYPSDAAARAALGGVAAKGYRDARVTR
jgi:rare lipoprotein A